MAGGRARASGPRSPAEKTGTGPSRTGGPVRTDIDKAWGARCCESRHERKSIARGTGLVGTRRRPRGERALWARWLSLALKPRSTRVQGRQDHMRFSPQRRGWETEGQLGAVIAQRQGTDSCLDGGKVFTHSGTYQALARQSTGEKKLYIGARRQAPARPHKSCVYFCIRAGVGGMHDGFGWTGQGALGGLGWNTDTLPGRPIRNGPLKKWPSPRSPARVDGDPGVSTCPVVQPPRPPTAHNHSGALWGRGGAHGMARDPPTAVTAPRPPPGPKPG